MIQTLNTAQAANLLMENSSFSYHGAYALINYIEQLEEDTSELIEFDAVAIRCDYSEYDTAYFAAEDYGYSDTEDYGYSDTEDNDEREKNALNWLQDQTSVIEFDGGVIVEIF